MRRLLPAVLLVAMPRVVLGQPGAPAPAPDPAPESAPATTDEAAPAPPPEAAPPDDAEVASREEPAPPRVQRTLINSNGCHVTKCGLQFGSYGRVLAGTDLRGGKPEGVNVVAHGPRIVEPSYLELDFSYGFTSKRGVKLRPVVTLAFDATLFHDTGDFDAQPALRNMYLDARVDEHLALWVGSRMYRGDDIYLFDYWPLDDLNTVGGGVVYTTKPVELAAHVGVNRLNDPFQYQQVEVPNPVQGATTAVQLDRQRMIASISATYLHVGPPNDVSIKAKLHGQVHALPAGTRERDDGTYEALPADWGFLAGGELSLFGMSSDEKFRRHLNLYARYAKGLAAFDELAAPTSFGPELKTTRASELTFGTSGNWDHRAGNVMLGALARRFVDADTSTRDADDGWEYAVDLRPQLRVRPDVFAGVDVSYQARFPQGLNNIVLRAEDPAVFQIAPMLVFSPMGPSSYDRPQLRLVYRAAHLNQAALDLYVPDDARSTRPWVHYLGVQAEWWWNSSRYR